MIGSVGYNNDGLHNPLIRPAISWGKPGIAWMSQEVSKRLGSVG